MPQCPGINENRRDLTPRKSRFEFSVQPMNWLCIQSLSIPLKIASLLIVKRSVPLSFLYLSVATRFMDANLQADEAYQVGKGLTPVGAYLAQDDIIRIALEHGVDMIHPG